MGETNIYEIKNNSLRSFTIHPSDFGLETHDIKEVESKSPEENAATFRLVLSGEGNKAIHDFICINAGAALFTTGHASSIGKGVEIANNVIENGDAAAKVAAFVDSTQKYISN